MGRVLRNCLVCNHRGMTNENPEEYQRIQVCPKCRGAYVDMFHIHLYMNKDQEPKE